MQRRTDSRDRERCSADDAGTVLSLTGLSMHRLATRLRTHLHSQTHGQSLVEFALVLPIIMMLTLTSLDFGRGYLCYINLQNMARTAANFSPSDPELLTRAQDACY